MKRRNSARRAAAEFVNRAGWAAVDGIVARVSEGDGEVVRRGAGNVAHGGKPDIIETSGRRNRFGRSAGVRISREFADSASGPPATVAQRLRCRFAGGLRRRTSAPLETVRPRMRIGFVYDAVYPYVIGGAEHRNYALAEQLRRRHAVEIIGYDYWSADPTRRLAGVEYVGVGRPVAQYDARGRRRIGQALQFAARLAPALRRSRAEIFDCSNFPFFSVPVARLGAALGGRKLVVTWHEFWGRHWRNYSGTLAPVGRLVERLVLWSSPHVIAVSEHTRRALLAAGYPERRVTVVSNGVDCQAIAEVPRSADATDLIYAGRLVSHKRVDLAIRAAALLPGVTLAIVGEGPERPNLERLATELGVTDRVRFVGYLPTERDVYAQLKSARVLVFPSQREGFGLTVVQGWACGLPAVVCDAAQSALPSLMDDPRKGCVVASNAEALAGACRKLLDAPRVERSEVAELARPFDWPQIVERLEQVYAQILNGSER